ncbi:pilus assembly protein N-terminal domain-containing protein [Planctomicrobium sp. SH527]|uniref:type II and III secretion system protein family protein n=1 Tax=Planctomicrobium sp. SH527 TaxID=3448123 RepID=UPI003F5C2F14
MRSLNRYSLYRTFGGLMLSVAFPWNSLVVAQPPLPPPGLYADPMPDQQVQSSNPGEPAPTLAPRPLSSPVSPPTGLFTPPAPAPQVPSSLEPAAPMSSRENRTASQPPIPVQPGESVLQISTPSSKLKLRALDTRVLELSNRIKVVDGFDPECVDIQPLSPHRVRLQALKIGVTTVKLIDEFDNFHLLEVFIEPDVRELQAYLQRLFPGSAIDVIGVRGGVVLRGWVTMPSQLPEVVAVAEQFYEVVQPQLTVAGPNQVQFVIKVIEVQRSKIRELGFNFLLSGKNYYVHNGVGGISPFGGVNSTVLPTASSLGSAAAKAIDASGSTMQFAVTGNNTFFQGFLEALVTENLAKVLAEPVVTTVSGRPATVHSGGRFPVPSAAGLGSTQIDWEDFGVKLEALPIILGEGRLRLDVFPEVSERDYTNSVVANGQVIPSVMTRSVNTQVEMRFGETLMIGGLISTRTGTVVQKVPFLGELPWIGMAFSRKRQEVGETELVILLTPQMVAPMASHQVPTRYPGSSSSNPNDRELYIDGNLEVPNFGPECPNGDCGQEFYQNVPMEITPISAARGGNSRSSQVVQATKPSAKSSGKSEIQQASSEQLAKPMPQQGIVNPFQVEAASESERLRKEVMKTPVFPEPKFTPVESTPVKKPSDSLKKSSDSSPRGLPGMITPTSGNQVSANQ